MVPPADDLNRLTCDDCFDVVLLKIQAVEFALGGERVISCASNVVKVLLQSLIKPSILMTVKLCSILT